MVLVEVLPLERQRAALRSDEGKFSDRGRLGDRKRDESFPEILGRPRRRNDNQFARGLFNLKRVG